jgi:putative ABC transport system permease protein
VIGHVFRLAWNRRRANALILTEIFVCFLVLCALTTALSWFGLNWIRPLGFDWHDVLHVEMRQSAGERNEEANKVFLATIQRLLAETSDLPGVESAALISNVPYNNSETTMSTYAEGREAYVFHSPVTVEALDVLRLKLKAGRWLQESDQALGWRPAVISEKLARAWFPGQDPLGRTVPNYDSRGRPRERDPEDPETRVVGVVADYRRSGEPLPIPYCEFAPADFARSSFSTPEALVVRMVPGAPPDFEAKLAERLQAVAPDWSFRIEPLSRMRERTLRHRLLPLAIGVAVSIFLVLMVGMGLIGVLWQSVARRTSEIGVRRAMGATTPHIMGQIVGEILALTTLAMLAGGFLFMQLPMLRAMRDVPPQIFLLGLIEASVMLYLFVSFCGLYPGWLATRVQPAEALQHD